MKYAQLILCFCLFSSTAFAQQHFCKARGYVIDQDPQGLNVRRAPNGEILGALPTDTEIEIQAMNNGWILISAEAEPQYFPYNSFNGLGWVYSRLVGVGTAYGPSSGKVNLYAAPSTQSTPNAIINSGLFGLAIIDCDGAWLKVQTADGKVGWLAPINQCSSSVTNCC